MGTFASKDYVAAIAAHVTAASWRDLLDQFQNFLYLSQKYVKKIYLCFLKTDRQKQMFWSFFWEFEWQNQLTHFSMKPSSELVSAVNSLCQWHIMQSTRKQLQLYTCKKIHNAGEKVRMKRRVEKRLNKIKKLLWGNKHTAVPFKAEHQADIQCRRSAPVSSYGLITSLRIWNMGAITVKHD